MKVAKQLLLVILIIQTFDGYSQVGSMQFDSITVEYCDYSNSRFFYYSIVDNEITVKGKTTVFIRMIEDTLSREISWFNEVRNSDYTIKKSILVDSLKKLVLSINQFTTYDISPLKCNGSFYETDKTIIYFTFFKNEEKKIIRLIIEPNCVYDRTVNALLGLLMYFQKYPFEYHILNRD